MTGIPESLQQFIATHISSLDQLEVLILLRREPERSWSADSVSRELRIERSWAARRLEDLQGRGFIVADASDPPAFRYQPSTSQLDRAIEELASTYAERRVAVIELIYAKPSSTIRTFAAAFRFRKDDSDG